MFAEEGLTDALGLDTSNLVARFARIVELHPGKVALVDIASGQRWTYAQLAARSRTLAAGLVAAGVGNSNGAGVVIGLGLSRSPDCVAAMIAILQVGAAYAPFDQQDPPARREQQLAAAGISLLVAEADFPAGGARLLTLQELEELASGAEQSAALPQPSPEDLAYVMFTSGSTGVPKCVEIPHRAVLRLVAGDYVSFGTNRVFLHHSPPAFDASTFELWGPLLHGGQCVLYPDQIPTVRHLARAIADYDVNVLWLTAALFNLMVEEDVGALAGLDFLLAGGEALSALHVRRALQALPATQLVNGYGPTECTTFACCYPIPRSFLDEAETASVPIGRPIAHTTAQALNDQLTEVEPGQFGELCLGGAGLARGYRHRPDLTAERFVYHPQTGERLYRTGDRVRQQPNGLWEFAGRNDDLVKLRGHRIELGEVNSALLRQPMVGEAVALLVSVHGRDHLVAFIRPDADCPMPSPAALQNIREGLLAELPLYMVPARLFPIATLPLTANGKVDRAALRELAIAEIAAHQSPAKPSGAISSVASSVAVADAIARQMALLLGVEHFAPTDEFFSRGGDSLSAVQLIAWLDLTYRVEIPFSHSLIPARLAEMVHGARPTPECPPGSVLLRQQTGQETPLFLLHGIDGQPAFYHALLSQLQANPVYGLTCLIAAEAPSMEQLAALHVQRILQLQPEGPFHLAGYSFGGVLAFEIACQLQRSGKTTGTVFLLDASTFGLQIQWSRVERLQHSLRRMAARVRHSRNCSPGQVLRYAGRRIFDALSSVLRAEPVANQLVRRQVADVLPNPEADVTKRLMDVMLAYAPQTFDGNLVLIRANDFYSSDTFFDPQHGWGKVTSTGIPVYTVPGNHIDMIKGENAKYVAAVINQHLRPEGVEAAALPEPIVVLSPR